MKRKIYNIGIIVSIVIFFYAGYNLYLSFSEYNNIEKENKELVNEYAYMEYTKEDKIENKKEIKEDNKLDVYEQEISIENQKIKWEELKELNKDIIAWIRIPNTNINYPILQGESNSKYLRTNIYGNYSKGGCIFVDSDNKNCFNSNNTIIYGHNLNNGSMFSDLKKYKKADFANSHNTIYIIMSDNVIKEYNIFAFYEIDSNNNDIYNINVTDLESYYKIINKYNGLKIYNNLDNTKQIITLSTCTNYNEQKRFIVQAFSVE